MAAQQIKFGTDGWRGIIADDFTFGNVRRVAQATAQYMKSRSSEPLAIVGYDCRFASEDFAEAVATVFAANGVKTLVFDRPSPTQVASWTVIDRKATGAVAITASHNPYQFNGYKYKTAGLRIVHECMYGSGYGYIAEMIGGGRTAVTELHNQRNPLFGGMNPEPIPPNIDSTIAVMKVGNQDLCICTDGDADRVGIID